MSPQGDRLRTGIDLDWVCCFLSISSAASSLVRNDSWRYIEKCNAGMSTHVYGIKHFNN